MNQNVFKAGDSIKACNPKTRNYGTVYKIISVGPEIARVKDSHGEPFLIPVSSFNNYVLTQDFFTPSVPFNKGSGLTDSNQPSNTAPDILKRAEEIMRERGKQYDQEGGERSMEKIVDAFNAITGHELTEAQGWMFMVILKLVRDNSRKVGHQDSCDDLTAYSALYGESRLS